MKTHSLGRLAYWNKIILGNKSQSEHCNTSAERQTRIDVVFSVAAASIAIVETNTVSSLLIEKYLTVHLCFWLTAASVARSYGFKSRHVCLYC